MQHLPTFRRSHCCGLHSLFLYNYSYAGQAANSTIFYRNNRKQQILLLPTVERLLKNEGIFRENICVGVRWYGSQIFSRKTGSRAGFSMIPARFQYLLQMLDFNIYSFPARGRPSFSTGWNNLKRLFFHYLLYKQKVTTDLQKQKSDSINNKRDNPGNSRLI